MADTSLTHEDLKALESTRQKLFQLSNNIASLRNDVQRSNPLPQWSSLQTSSTILASNLQALTAHLSKHSDLLNRTVVFPSTTFPGRTQEGLLTQLLRKKLEPQVETWVEEGRMMQTTEATNSKDKDELLGWASDWINTRVAKYALEEAGDNYTVDEREQGIENINTGLQRKLEDDDSEEDDEDEEMDDVGVTVTSARRTSLGQVEYSLGEVKKVPSGKTRSVEEILRFATTGNLNDNLPNARR